MLATLSYSLLSIQCEEEVEMGRKLVPPLLLVTGLDLGTAAAAAAAVGGIPYSGCTVPIPAVPTSRMCVAF